MKIAIITGANSGIGYETTIELAKAGYIVVMACINISGAQESKKKILEQIPEAQLIIEYLDLGSLSSVRTFTEKIINQYNEISLLINNAGINNAPFVLTEDGFESTFQVNYLGHFYLTQHLLPLLEKNGNGRVITVTSYGHHSGVISFDNPFLQHHEPDNPPLSSSYNPFQAYFNSKLANLLFSRELDRRLRATGSSIKSIAVHPGSVQTNMLKKNNFVSLQYLFFSTGEKLIGQTAKEGAQCSVKACLDPDIVGGEFFGPGGLFELTGYPSLVNGSQSSNDKNLSAMLWQYTEELLDMSLNFKDDDHNETSRQFNSKW